MNNLELRKALHKINHACGDCGDCGGGGEVNRVAPNSDKYIEPCETCSGTGIDIALEFGCEVEVQLDEKYFKIAKNRIENYE